MRFLKNGERTKLQIDFRQSRHYILPVLVDDTVRQRVRVLQERIMDELAKRTGIRDLAVDRLV